MSEMNNAQQKELQATMEAFNRLAQSLGVNGGGRPGSFSRKSSASEQEKAIKQSVDETKDFNTSLKNLRKSARSLNLVFKELEEDLEDTGDAVGKLPDTGEELMKAFIESSKSLRKMSDESLSQARKLTNLDLTQTHIALNRIAKNLQSTGNQFADAQRKSSLMLTAVADQTLNNMYEFNSANEEFHDTIDSLREHSKGFMDKLSDSHKTILSDTDDVSSVIAKISEIKSGMFQALEGSELAAFNNNIDEFLDSVSKKRNNALSENNTSAISASEAESVLTAAILAQKQGANISDTELTDAQDTLKSGDTRAIKILAEKLLALSKAAQATEKSFERELKAREEFTHKLGVQAKNDMGKRLSELATFGGKVAAVTAAIDKWKKVIEEASAFNIANIQRSFMSVQATSIKMGMSFEETSKLMQENKPLLSALGQGFESNISQMSEAYRQYGYTTKQMAGLVQPLTDLTAASGVRLDSENAMGKASAKINKDFLGLSTAINMSQEEFIKFNTGLLNAEDQLAFMSGMNQQDRQQVAESVRALGSDQLRLLGSTDKAMALINSQMAEARKPAKTRLGESIKMKFGAKMAGMSDSDANELAQLKLKGANMTPEERARQLELDKKYALARDTQIRDANIAGFGSEVMVNTLQEKFGGPSQATIDAARLEEQRRQAGLIRTPEQLAKDGEVAQGNATFASANEALNMATSFMSNSIVAASAATGTALFALGGGAAWAAKKLASIGGGSLAGAAGDLLGNPGGKGKPGVPGGAGGSAGGGKWGKALGMGSKLLKGAGVAGAAYGVVDGVTTSNEEFAENPLLNIGSLAASGAVLGSVVPGVGTAIGAGVGGALGLGVGAYKYLKGKPSDQTKQPVEINTKEAEVTKVKELDDKLVSNMQNIADNTLRTAQLLQIIVEAQGKSSVNLRPAPTARQAQVAQAVG